MGGDQHRGAGVVVCDNGVEDVIPCGGIDAADGFIQQVQLCPAGHHQNQLNLFLIALGQRLEFGAQGDVQRGEHFLCPRPVKVHVKILKEIQLLLHPNLTAEIGAVREIGDHGLGGRPDFIAANGDLARCGGQQTCGQLDKGGLSAAVGAKKTDDLSLRQGQIQIVQSQRAVIAHGKAAGGQNSLFHVIPPSSFPDPVKAEPPVLALRRTS